jgi:hypothetical protein
VPAAIGLLGGPCVRSQATPSDRPAFEVASVRAAKGLPGAYRLPAFSKGRFTATATLAQVIATAYHLPFNPSKRLTGGVKAK